MTVLLLFASVVAVTLPDPVLVPDISAGETVVGAEIDGDQWIRVFEEDYAVLEVASSSAVPMTAYDNSGEPLAFSVSGEPLVLYAYSEYWFWVRADSDEPVRFSVNRQEALPMPANSVSSTVPASHMAEVWTFTAPEDGDWRFSIKGDNDNTDLDLELYGPRMSKLGGSYGMAAAESITMGFLAGETVHVVVSRYNKTGSGNYTLNIMRTGDMEEISTTLTGDAASGNVFRYKLPELEHTALLSLDIEGEDDLDLRVFDPDGNLIFSSNTYMYSEALLVPGGRETAVVEVCPCSIDEETESSPFTLSLTEPENFLSASAPTTVETGFANWKLLPFVAPAADFYTVAVVFDKFRDGDVRLFSDYGESAVIMETERGDERFALWADRGDTLWISPGFLVPGKSGGCEVSVGKTKAVDVSDSVSGIIGEGNPPQQFYTLRGEAGSTLVIELSSDQREFDLDMLVSGPGYHLQAQGGISGVDNAADESVALYCPDDALYCVTVYQFERSGKGSFTLHTENIPRESLAAGDPNAAETWALVTGISGYESRVDILSRSTMDATDFYRFLRDEQGIDPAHMELFVDADARVSDFKAAVRDICSRADPSDRLILFYSGHGGQETPGLGGTEEEDGMDEVLCYYDGDISDDEMHELVSEFPGTVLLFTDACNSGGFVNDFSPGDNILILTAAREDKSVAERVLTPILLEASKGAADTDGDGIITAGELYDYVDGMLARVCPVCDAIIDPGMTVCPECGTVLKGEYRIPRPEQGLFVAPDLPVWTTER